MPDPFLGHKDPLEIRVSVEDDPEEIEDLSLVPVGCGPHADDGGDMRRLGVRELHLHAQTLA
jgi:hypothetical protein